MTFRRNASVFQVVAVAVITAFLSSACAVAAPGASRPVYMGMGKTPSEFERDKDYCQNVAVQRTGVNPNEVGQQNTGVGAVIGMLFGAALGAAIGAATGSPSAGAAIGAGAGLIGGTGAGAAHGAESAEAAQRRFNTEYYECMYARGHQVPGSAVMSSQPPPQAAPPPPPPPPPSPSGSRFAPPAAYAAPAPSAAPCKQTGKYVKTPSGFQPECE